MELLVGALQEAALAEQAPFRFGQEGDMGRGKVIAGRDFAQRIGQRAAHRVMKRAGPGQQTRAGHRRERHGHLQFGIIGAAGALEGVRPAMVEHVFAARMGFYVTGRGAHQGAASIFQKQMVRLPAGAGTNRKRSFQ